MDGSNPLLQACYPFRRCFYTSTGENAVRYFAVLAKRVFPRMLLTVTATKKQEKTNQDKTKIGPFFDFFVHFPIFLFEILNIAPQLSCEAMLKNSNSNIKKCNRKSKKGPILIRNDQSR